MKPLVSVIVPNYCHSMYLEQRLDSIIHQTYCNIEVIILDDNSPDEGASKNIIERYRSHDKVTHIVYNDVNSGSTFIQWSKGIDLATGEIIWIAESDDFCELNMLEKLVNEYLKYDDSVITYTPAVVVDENGNIPICTFKSRIAQFLTKNINKTQHFSSSSYLRRYLAMGCAITNASSAIFSREKSLEISSEYKILPAAGDYMFWTLLAEKGSVTIVNQSLSYFRRHSGTVTSKNDASGLNFKMDLQIIDYIRSRYRISTIRNRLIKLKYAIRIDNSISDSLIKEQVLDYWNISSPPNIFEKCIYKVYNLFIRFCGAHL